MIARLRLLRAFVRRDSAVALSYPVPLALGALSIVFSLLLFYYLGRLVDDSSIDRGAQLEEGYFPFAVIGLAMFQLASSGLLSFATRFREEQTTGTLEALLTTPAPPAVVVLGTAAFDLLRATLGAIGLILIAIVFFGSGFEVSTALVQVPFAVAGALVLFAALGLALASFAIVYKQAAGAVQVMMPGIALLSGVYFPVSLIPEPLRTVAEAFPLTWALDVLRAALLTGDTEIGKLVALVAAGAVALPAAMWLFGVSLRRARREGTLAQH